MTDFIDEVMGFNPADLNAFNELESTNNFNANIYKTNPKDSKSEDGVYRCKLKVVYDPNAPKDSIVHQATYFLKSADGSMLVRSRLGNGPTDPNFKDCSIFKCWKKLWFSGDDAQKERAKRLFQKNESDYVLVQIIEDENKPDMVGKFMAMKLPKIVYDKLQAKMSPSKESKKTPYPVMDYVIGLELNMEVQPGPDDPSAPERKQREISYSLCDFGDYAPIINVDGTPFFSEEELETIDNYVTAVKDSTGAKTEAKRKAAQNQLEVIRPQVKKLYQKAFEYVKENAFNLREEVGYKEWDEKTATFVNHWIEIVTAGGNPETTTYEDFKNGVTGTVTPNTTPYNAGLTTNSTDAGASDLEPRADDLPF